MTKNQAETVIKRAWIACLASVLVCIATIALVVFASIGYAFGPKPWNLSNQLVFVFIKLLVILGLGYGMARRRRFFASALFALFCIGHLVFLSSMWSSGLGLRVYTGFFS